MTELACLTEISADLTKISATRDENIPYEHSVLNTLLRSTTTFGIL